MNEIFLPIDDTITRLEGSLSRAKTIIQEVTEGYFKYAGNHITEEARFAIQYGYPKCAVLSDIVFDYINLAQNELKDIRAYVNGEVSSDV